MSIRPPLASSAVTLAVAATLAACGGGGGGGSVPPPVTNPSPASTSTVSTQQVVKMAEPDTAMGSIIDPTFKVLIGGFTQATFSQTLAFAPGAQIMIQNAQGANVSHTFQVISTTSFPPSPSFSLSPAGGSTIGTGFATGTVSSGQSVGPFTLTAGTWFIGCAFHYTSENMRTVLQVATGATPGPQATVPPQATPPPVGGLY